jgi:outer membrane protein assembly factor BamA
VRSFLLLIVAVAAAAWIAVGYLPTSVADADPVVSQNQEVRSVSIDGRRLPLASLRAVLSTHPGDQLDANRLVLDRSALEAELQGLGYLAARVEPAVVNFSSSGAAFVTFQITQGPVFRLRSVTVTGATARDSVVTLTAGDDAIASRIERARQTLADNLARHGKPASVTVALRTDVAAAAVDVELIGR